MHYMRRVYPLKKIVIWDILRSLNRLCYFISDKEFTKFDTLRPSLRPFPLGVVDFSVIR